MKSQFLLGTILLGCVTALFAQSNYLGDYHSREWQELIRRGEVPYHQLTPNDFAVRRASNASEPVWLRQFLTFRHDFKAHPCGGEVCVEVTGWRVYSGMNRNESGRIGGNDQLAERLPYLQGLMDIHEIHARKLAVTPLQKLPTGRGPSRALALTDLNVKLRAFCQAENDVIRSATEKYVTATRNGKNTGRVRRWQRRLTRRLAKVGIGR